MSRSSSEVFGEGVALGLPDGSRLARLVAVLLAVYFLAIPLVRIGQIPVGSTFVQISDLLFLITGGAWLVAVVTKALPLPPMRYVAPCLALLASAVVSLSATPHLRMSIIKLVGLAYLVAIGFVTASVGRQSKKALAFVLASFSAGAIITGILGTLSVLMFYAGIRDRSINVFLWNTGSVPVGNYPRVVVFFLNANMLCSYLLVGLGAMGMLLPLVRRSLRRWLVVAAIPIVITATFTLSTGLGGIGLGGVLGWIWWQSSERRVKLWREVPLTVGALGAAAGLALITIFLLVPAGKGDLRLGPVDLSYETSGRVAVWKSAAETYAAHPVRGIGIGNPAAVTDHPRALNATDALGTPRERKGLMPFEAHNVWLNVAAQLGSLGLFSFIWLSFEVLRHSWPRRSAGKALFAAQIAAVSAWVAAVGYHGLFGAFEDSRQYWCFFGLAAALGALVTEHTMGATETAPDRSESVIAMGSKQESA